jgi:D-threo-aldose 1-dehydrogenase
VVELLPTALARGVDVIVAGLFNSGILANPVDGATFEYVPAPQELIVRSRKIRDLLDLNGVSLAAATMQFPFRHPPIKSVLVGCRSVDELYANVHSFGQGIGEEVWADIVPLL